MASKTHVQFQLMGKKRPRNWQLPITGMMLPRYVDGKYKGNKQVEYIKGHDSIFKEDHIGDEKPSWVWFTDGLLDVSTGDLALLQILENHKMKDRVFEKVDEDKQAKTNLELIEKKQKALEMVDIADEDKMYAIATILVGPHVTSFTPAMVEHNLKSMALEQPEKIMEEMDNPNYNAKVLGALAVRRGVIVINPQQTLISWKNGKAISPVAAGQDPIVKLSDFLSGKDELTRNTIQAIQEEIKRSYNFKKDYTAEEELAELLGDNAPEAVTLPETDGDPAEEELEEARATYKETFGKEVSNNKKNDLEWIKEKIAEGPTED